MLMYDKLSYWEKVTHLENIDYLVLGSGIVGLNTAIALKQRQKHAKVVVLERGYLPSGASTKNAGFACFGSPSELLVDIDLMGEEKTAELLKLRWLGLQKLLSNLGVSNLDFEKCGSYDLFRNSEIESFENAVEQLPYLNAFIETHLGLKECYSISEKPLNQGMQDLCGSIFNQHEGSIHTGKMMLRLYQLALEFGVQVLHDSDVKGFCEKGNTVEVETQWGTLTAAQLLICTNGLSQRLLPDLDLKPARAQVLVTSPIQNLSLNSTYHYDSGYYYFRVVEGNRILIGGARNQDFEGETTELIETSEKIKSHIINLLREVIIPNQHFQIDYEWAGIMGVGSEKMPLIGSPSSRIHYAVRMGGMGVAMGSEIGVRLAEWVFSKKC
jgi:glycine/D-amino acid oxidase-like deaminating enzyme